MKKLLKAIANVLFKATIFVDNLAGPELPAIEESPPVELPYVPEWTEEHPDPILFRIMFNRRGGEKFPIVFDGEQKLFDADQLYSLITMIRSSKEPSPLQVALYHAIIRTILKAEGDSTKVLN